MNTLKLKQSDVQFDELHHSYSFGEERYSGVTTIITKYIFHDYYDNVPEKVLEAARKRGTTVHNELQLLFEGLGSDTPEVLAWRGLAKQYKLKQIAAEYLVGNHYYKVASSIDNVSRLKDGSIALIDYKSTDKLNIEYLRWQLSIYAYFFEQMNDLHVAKLYAAHLPKPKDIYCDGTLTEIERIDNATVEQLLECHKSGADTFRNPLHVDDDAVNVLLTKYVENYTHISELKGQLESYETENKNITEQLKKLFDAKAQTSWKKDNITITRTADQVRRTFDRSLIVNELPAKWLKYIDENGYKSTKIEGNVKVTIK